MTPSLELCISNVDPYRCLVVLVLHQFFDNLKWLISVCEVSYGTKTDVSWSLSILSLSISATVFVTVI